MCFASHCSVILYCEKYITHCTCCQSGGHSRVWSWHCWVVVTTAARRCGGPLSPRDTWAPWTVSPGQPGVSGRHSHCGSLCTKAERKKGAWKHNTNSSDSGLCMILDTHRWILLLLCQYPSWSSSCAHVAGGIRQIPLVLLASSIPALSQNTDRSLFKLW